MTNLIGISGRSGSGKDLIASIIQYLIWRRDVESDRRDYMSLTLNSFINNNNLGKAMSGFKVVKYADKLKDIICLLTKLNSKKSVNFVARFDAFIQTKRDAFY